MSLFMATLGLVSSMVREPQMPAAALHLMISTHCLITIQSSIALRCHPSPGLGPHMSNVMLLGPGADPCMKASQAIRHMNLGAASHLMSANVAIVGTTFGL